MSEQPEPPQNTTSIDDPSLVDPVIVDPISEEQMLTDTVITTDSLTDDQREGVERKFGLRALKRLVAVGLFAMTAAGCVPQSHDSVPPTQRDVASVEIGGASVGLEGDANGYFNSRTPEDIPNNQYKKDCGIIDEIPGLPNLVIGIPDDSANGAPKGDGWIARHTSSSKSSSSSESSVKTDEVKIRIPETKTVTDEKVITGSEIGNTQYERDFETDHSTFEQALTPAETVAKETLSLVVEGYSVNAVIITGRASGEDHTKGGPNANIGEPSENNQELSNQRAAHGERALDQAFQDRKIDISGAALTIQGQEVEPTSEQLAQLQSAADSLGITVNELTERFNTFSGSFTPEQLSLLHETLTNNRGVMYEIHASKDISVPTGDFKTTVIKLPKEVITSLGGSEEKSDWLFRIEIPGEILLLLAALAAAKLAGNIPIIGGSSGIGEPGVPIPIPPPVGKGKPPEVVDPPPPPPGGNERFPRPRNQPNPRQRYDSVWTPRKQPREQNFGKNRSNLAGGKGRTERSRGGDRRGKRGPSR